MPFDKVESLQAQPDPIMGAFKALRLWQSKHQTIARGCPPTWEFLLKAVNDCASPRVSNEIAERVAVEETFSEQVWFTYMLCSVCETGDQSVYMCVYRWWDPNRR